jgi:hypothetical protein
MAGEDELGRTHVRSALAIDPSMRAEAILKLQHYKQPQDVVHHRDALMRAGFPM